MSGDFRPGIWSVAGPDAEGCVAFVEAYFPKPSHALKTIRLDGSREQAIFQHQGDPIWKRAIGRHMALAPTGGRLALVGQMHGVQMPRALLDEGPLEVWNIDERTDDMFGQMIDDGIAWLPDSRHVACVRLLPRDRLPQVKEPEDGFGKLWARWERVPAICLIDVGTGQERVICEGVEPVVSTDGTQLLVADYASGAGRLWRRVQISTGSAAAVPSSLNRTYLAFDAAGKSLYLAAPLPGERSEKTKYFSPLRGPSEMLALRFGPLDQPASAAVRIADGFDPRDFASFGYVDHSHHSPGATDR